MSSKLKLKSLSALSFKITPATFKRLYKKRYFFKSHSVHEQIKLQIETVDRPFCKIQISPLSDYDAEC